jgi:tetratricopeptide (TPR) repeat protein
MSKVGWDAPKTEEGLQHVLRRLEECRASGDHSEIGNGLLTLAFLVKWVRSDTDMPPFMRAHELSLQALEEFRQAGDVKGQIRALDNATPFADAKTREAMLVEAEALAASIGDQDEIARVLAARARSVGVSAEERGALYRQAVEIFRETGNQGGLARCLFGLAIGDGTDVEKRAYALEGASLYRALEDHAHASMLMMVALMNVDDIDSPEEIERLATVGLQDAMRGEKTSSEQHFCTKLAEALAAQGREAEAEAYRRRAQDLEDAEGLTPRERWEQDVAGTKMIIALAMVQENAEAVAAFGENLERLLKEEPT